MVVSISWLYLVNIGLLKCQKVNHRSYIEFPPNDNMYYLFANKYYPSNVLRAYICAQNIHKLPKPLRLPNENSKN